jgi:hypothetical protein
MHTQPLETLRTAKEQHMPAGARLAKTISWACSAVLDVKVHKT